MGLMCGKCHNVDGPFLVDLEKGKVLCEDCEEYEEVVEKFTDLIRHRTNTKKLSVLEQVSLIDGIESEVLDRLGLR